MQAIAKDQPHFVDSFPIGIGELTLTNIGSTRELDPSLKYELRMFYFDSQ